MKAMIFAAGMGTRLQPLTLKTPKALVEIDGVPLLEIIILRLKKYGFTDIVINIHHFAQQIIDFINANDSFGVKIHFSDETALLLDTGGGLMKAQELLNDGEPVLIHNIDVITNINLRELYDFHLKHNPLVTLAVKDRKTSRSLLVNNEGILCGWKNNATGETIIARGVEHELLPIAYSCVQVIDPKLFSLLTEKDVFSIMPAFLRLAKDYNIATWKHNDDFWYEVGRIENIKDAASYLQRLD